ncbi:hypothetical protein L0F63_004006 [Massospora cicadina]|nr:hypothetical protein L0F63_004006 [Massospora cicadina]
MALLFSWSLVLTFRCPFYGLRLSSYPRFLAENALSWAGSASLLCHRSTSHAKCLKLLPHTIHTISPDTWSVPVTSDAEGTPDHLVVDNLELEVELREKPD